MNATTSGAQLVSTTQITITGGSAFVSNSTYAVRSNNILYWEVIEYV